MDSKKQILQQCYHCGNKGLLVVEGSHSHDFNEYSYNAYGGIDGVIFSEKMSWYLLSCPVCNNVTLFETYSNDCPGSESEKILYPCVLVDHYGVPKHIKSAYDSAVKAKGIDTAICLLSLRRTLEAICKDKGANGKTLEEKIKDLVSDKILPETLNDACWIIRQLGNDAAHADNTVFSIHEVNQVIDFVGVIINYLYSMPVRIEKLKLSIEESKKECKEEVKADD